MEMGPPLNHRIGKEETENLIINYDFKGISSMKFSEEFYGIVFTKECEEMHNGSCCIC